MKTFRSVLPAACLGACAFPIRTSVARCKGTVVLRQAFAWAAAVLTGISSPPLHAQSNYAVPGTISTLAGGGRSGASDGTGAAARFDNPTSLAADAAGNLYVADTFNHTVRKITPAGVVTTLAGSAPLEGTADGTGSAARFFYPSGVAVDAAGNVYVTDEKHTIRKITPAGVVSTFAGSAGNSGSADGPVAAARFKNPDGIALDGSGNIFVSDRFNGTIRKISVAGVVTTLAGSPGEFGSADGVGSSARFGTIGGLAIDPSGNIYVADRAGNTIRKITSAGVVTTFAGTAGQTGSADGTGAAAQFDDPTGVALDGAGNLYVTDSSNHTLRRITPAGVVTTVAGTPKSSGQVNAVGSAARFFTPYGIAINAAGELFIADSINDAIRKAVVPGSAPIVNPPANPPPPTGLVSRISNVSVRTTLVAEQTLIVGFTMQGGAKSLLLRAVGPGLAAFGVGGTMADPRCALYNGSVKLEENDNWGGGTTLSGVFASVGSFPLPAASLDSALLRSLDGGHTAQISGATGGTVLVEAYDAGAGLSPRLTNISARNRAGTGSDVLIAGFTIAGTGPKNLLIRAVGPTLGGFGVSSFLGDPKLEVFSGSSRIAENDTWAAGLTAVFASVGAFPLAAGSRDAALVLSLSPGSYTVQVAGADGGTGEALIEIYELP